MASNTMLVVICTSISGDTTASWTWTYQAIQNSGAAGTVTSVGMTVPAFLSVSGSPVTGAGSFAVSYSGTALPIANGGTGQTNGYIRTVSGGPATSVSQVSAVAIGWSSSNGNVQTIYVSGAGAAVTMTANPCIASGTIIGQELRLVGLR